VSDIREVGGVCVLHTPLPHSHLGLDTAHNDDRFTSVLVSSALTTKYANSSRTLLVVLLSSHTTSPWFSHFYIFNITLCVNSGSGRRALPLVITCSLPVVVSVPPIVHPSR